MEPRQFKRRETRRLGTVPQPRPESFAVELKARVAEMERAVQDWQAVKEGGEKAKFTLGWLRDHGYSGLEKWIRTRDALADIVATCSPAVSEAFERRLSWTPERIQAALTQAHARWTEAGRPGEFGRAWFRQTGYAALDKALVDNQGWANAVALASDAVRTDFCFHESPYTLDTAQAKFCEAHAVWLSAAPETRGEFNPFWLRRNGFAGLESWIREQYQDFGMIAVLAGEAVGRDFKEHPQKQ